MAISHFHKQFFCIGLLHVDLQCINLRLSNIFWPKSGIVHGLPCYKSSMITKSNWPWQFVHLAFGRGIGWISCRYQKQNDWLVRIRNFADQWNETWGRGVEFQPWCCPLPCILPHQSRMQVSNQLTKYTTTNTQIKIHKYKYTNTQLQIHKWNT